MLKTNIMFSQVREDPMIENFSLQNIKKNQIKCLIVGSGGCTLFTLLSLINDNKNLIIDVIDINKEQIYLIKLKLEVICLLKNIDAILDFFEGNMQKNEYDQIFNEIKLCLDSECALYWHKNIDLIYSGINQNGNFENIFKELVTSNFDYEKIFNRNNLSNKFGADAVKNSKNNEFSIHFKNIIEKYKKEYTIDNNYFFHQIIKGKYNRSDLPYYFNNINNIIKHRGYINFINKNMVEFIEQTTETYDLIQTSNLTDWMDTDAIKEFIKNIYKILNDDGYIVMRRLNGDYYLNNLVSYLFTIQVNIPVDKSHFYSEVIVGKKLQEFAQ